MFGSEVWKKVTPLQSLKKKYPTPSLVQTKFPHPPTSIKIASPL